MNKATCLSIILLLGLLSVSAHGADDKASRFDGVWRAEYTASEAFYEMELSGNRFRAVDGEASYTGEFVIDTEADPARIDFIIRECECGFLGKTSKGIFRWDGDVIEIRGPSPDDPRPTKFDVKAADTMRLVRKGE